MKRIILAVTVIVTIVLISGVSPSFAQRNFGSNLRATPNLPIGCNLAPILDPINGTPVLAATNQTTCTMRNLGYLNSIRLTSFVPGNGRITRFRVRSGPNPAPLRVTVSEGGPGTCCTARAFSRVFRPRPNRVSVGNINMPVFRSAHPLPNGQLAQITDVIGLSAVGPGTLPLRDEGTASTFAPGSAFTQFWYPLTRIGDPRVEGTVTADGLELLFQWTFVASTGRQVN